VTAMADWNGAVVLRYFEEFWNARRLEAADEIVAPDYVNHGPNDPGTARGPEAVKAVAREYLAEIPDVRFRVEHIVAEGDYVAARWTCWGTHRSGRPVSVTGIAYLRLEGGRIAESWNQWDAAGYERQIGGRS